MRTTRFLAVAAVLALAAAVEARAAAPPTRDHAAAVQAASVSLPVPVLAVQIVGPAQIALAPELMAAAAHLFVVSQAVAPPPVALYAPPNAGSSRRHVLHSPASMSRGTIGRIGLLRSTWRC